MSILTYELQDWLAGRVKDGLLDALGWALKAFWRRWGKRAHTLPQAV